MGIKTTIFITSLAVLLLSNITLYIIYPASAHLTTIADLGTTVFILFIFVILIIMSFQIFGSGLSDAKPIIMFIVILAILYKVDIPAELTGVFGGVSGSSIGLGLVTNLWDFLGVDYGNIGFFLINGLGWLCLISGVMSMLGSET